MRNRNIRTLAGIKSRFLFFAVLGVVVLVGVAILVLVKAGSPFQTTEPEGGSAKNGAYVKSDSNASGGKGIIFTGPAANFTSNITSSSTKFQLERGDYGSPKLLIDKGYTRLSLVDIADQATSASTPCELFGQIDSKLDWRPDTTCQGYASGADNWHQQGLTGVGNSGYADRSDILVASWHYNDDKARITVLNKTTGKQAFVRLVRTCDDNTTGYCDMGTTITDACAGVHADGVAWYKSYLFMADGNCIIAFNVAYAFKVADGTLVLPVSHYWHRTNTDLNYNTLGLDLSGSVPQLMTAEYKGPAGEACGGSMIVRYTLDPDTQTIAADSGNANLATSDATLITKKCYVQGIAYTKGMYFLVAVNSESVPLADSDYIYRVRTIATAPPDAKFLMPLRTPEGLYIDEKSGITWNLTEQADDADMHARIYGWNTASALEHY